MLYLVSLLFAITSVLDRLMCVYMCVSETSHLATGDTHPLLNLHTPLLPCQNQNKLLHAIKTVRSLAMSDSGMVARGGQVGRPTLRVKKGLGGGGGGGEEGGAVSQ